MLRSLRNKLVGTYLLPRFLRAGYRKSDYINLDPISLEPTFGYDDEPASKAAAMTVRNHAMTSYERMATLWNQVKYLDHYSIPGCFVECGTYRGGSVGQMALAHLSTHKTAERHLHLFDSFEGLPEPDKEVDGKTAAEFVEGRASGKLISTGKCVGSLEQNKLLLETTIGYPRSMLHYHIGWFQATLPKLDSDFGPIALLRLDGDWYESTKLPLEYLYEKVSKGGVIVIDDYGHFEGAKRAVDEFIAARKEPILLNHIDYTARFWLKS